MYSGSLYIASDHGGYHHKKRLLRYLQKELNIPVEDMGPASYTEDDDYPDYVIPLAQRVVKENARGIVICKNGIGVCIAANKVRGIRAGIGYNISAAQTMVTDDNTNILCLAAKLSSEDHAMAIVKKWLETEFTNEERYVRRLQKVAEAESNTT